MSTTHSAKPTQITDGRGIVTNLTYDERRPAC